MKNQLEKEKEERALNTCSMCGFHIKSEIEKVKPRWQWNLERGSILCHICYEKKDKEFDKERNYCSICGSNLKFFRYNPKPHWNISGSFAESAGIVEMKYNNK